MPNALTILPDPPPPAINPIGVGGGGGSGRMVSALGMGKASAAGTRPVWPASAVTEFIDLHTSFAMPK